MKALGQIIKVEAKSLRSLDKTIRITLEFNESEIIKLSPLLQDRADQLYMIEFNEFNPISEGIKELQ